ncbi:STAS domain-containing protein [Ornithinibacillus halophilus]|uniref:Anti-sigma factor antagonist n=1 Tax=Ornithinibacillus halophilus TaxID=930117 RepID=A0A1M5IU62_9BACI|nr:STAS domain-containing protein [Ornithinibacillus halophilus]SHG31864.1 anti-sigma B factor antagonist [Ornithinibacillus halophilus]
MEISINVKEENEKVVINVSGEIDVFTAPQLKEKIIPLVSAENAEVIVDFKDVNYMDSTGLGVLINAYKATKVNNSHIKIINLQDRVYRIFTITGLDEVMDINPVMRGGIK